MSLSDSNLVWLDLEMTGLDPRKDFILEIATIVTDCQLNIVAEGPNLVIHQPDHVLDAMDEWCTNQHGKSGLTQKVKDSTLTEADAIKQTMAFLEQYVAAGESPLCGNSIGQDRRFLFMHMPELENFFHYRSIDVSTIKELARRWKPELPKKVKKQGTHLALDDIRESIMELQLYKDEFFNV